MDRASSASSDEDVDNIQFDCPYKTLGDVPCNVCQKRTQLARRISEAKQQLAEVELALRRMLDEEQGLMTRINRVHNPIILESPLEIASYIFQLCVPRITKPSPSRDCVYNAVRAPLVLAAVCRGWRRIAFSVPLLWTNISIPLDSRFLPNHVEVIREWINRSAPLPLSIYAANSLASDRLPGAPDVYPEATTVVEILKEHSHRWMNLDIFLPRRYAALFSHIPRSSPVFQSLKIGLCNYDDIQKYNMKNLRPTSVAYFGILFRNLTLDWSNVTRVKIERIRFADCLKLLRQALQLTYCKFMDIQPSPTSSLTTSPIIHRKIQSFQIKNWFDVEIMGFFFEHITFPALQRLELKLDGGDLPQDALLLFFKRSSCELKELSLSNACIDDADFTTFLSKIPSLTRLEIFTSLDEYSLRDLFDKLSQSSLPGIENDKGEMMSLILPDLCFLQFSVQSKSFKSFPWTSLPKIFGSLSELSDPLRRPLRSVHIHFGARYQERPSQVCIPLKVIPSLLGIKKAGIDLKITCEGSERDVLEPHSGEDADLNENDRSP